ncbi:phosphatase PAP2 family protein [Streptomyces sp. V1I1]|uniref:phosphatase PAP2 family protein n=1 Tax=Streptomyces sp. V1I1 TaxID=3042272 RepID=UPI00278609C2|nr:phosphatase PAP2 family protein [Streptomyces sp. V1I1]MDQ0945152.1 membrane-associated phospholipid phosphatase [Streptomyces sp. V1I1]
MHFPRSAPPTPPEQTRVGVAARTGALLAALSAVLLTLVAVSWSPLVSFDRTVADGLHGWAVTEPGLTRVNLVLTDWVWDPWTMRALTAAAVLWLWWLREWLLAVWVAVTSAVGTFVQQGLKSAVGRERPQWPDPVDSAHYAAFPSGHAMTAMVSCTLLLWLLRRHGGEGRLWHWSIAAAVVSVVGVGLTRLYLGVHWPSDVVGGWLLGACWAALSIAAYERVVLSRQR